MDLRVFTFISLCAFFVSNVAAECDSGCWGLPGFYCNDLNSCEADSVFTANPPTLGDFIPDKMYSKGTYSSFNLVMVSDIQFGYYNCKEQAWLCIFDSNNDWKHPTSDEIGLSLAVGRQETCLNQLIDGNTKMIIDGGDLTNDAKKSEKKDYNTFINKFAIDKVLTLGNHDYYMQTGSNALKKSSIGAARMITYLKDSLNFLKNSGSVNLMSVDIKTGSKDIAGVGPTIYTKGSLMFSVEVQGYVFIVMHWAPNIRTAAYTDKFAVTTDCDQKSTCKTESKNAEYYEIEDGYTWLETQLGEVDKYDKKVILVPHYAEALDEYLTAGSTNLRQLVKKHVVAVLTGHDHDQWGLWGYLNVNNNKASASKRVTNEIPIYFAGSSSYEKLIKVELDYDADSVVVTPYTTREDKLCSVTASDNSDIKKVPADINDPDFDFAR